MLKIPLQLLSILSPIIPILIFLIFKHNRKERLKWVIFVLLLLGVLVDLLGLRLAKHQSNNVWLINIYTLVEFSLLSFFFIRLQKFKQNKFHIFVYATFLLLWMIQNFIIQNINQFDYFSQAIEFLILFIFCLLYFFKKAKTYDTIFIYNTYEFWLVTAILIYCAGTFFSFFIPMNINERNKDTLVFEYISRLGNIFKSILIAIAFTIDPKKFVKKQPNPNSIYYVTDFKEQD